MPIQKVLVRMFSRYSRCATRMVLFAMSAPRSNGFEPLVRFVDGADEDLVQRRFAVVETLHGDAVDEPAQGLLRIAALLQVDLGVFAVVVDPLRAGQLLQHPPVAVVVELDSEV